MSRSSSSSDEEFLDDTQVDREDLLVDEINEAEYYMRGSSSDEDPFTHMQYDGDDIVDEYVARIWSLVEPQIDNWKRQVAVLLYEFGATMRELEQIMPLQRHGALVRRANKELLRVVEIQNAFPAMRVDCEPDEIPYFEIVGEEPEEDSSSTTTETPQKSGGARRGSNRPRARGVAWAARRTAERNYFLLPSVAEGDETSPPPTTHTSQTGDVVLGGQCSLNPAAAATLAPLDADTREALEPSTWLNPVQGESEEGSPPTTAPLRRRRDRVPDRNDSLDSRTTAVVPQDATATQQDPSSGKGKSKAKTKAESSSMADEYKSWIPTTRP